MTGKSIGRSIFQSNARYFDEVAFALLLGLRPLPYQVEFLLDRSKRIIFVGGRQVGKTTMTAVKGLYNAIFNESWLILILAPTWRQSKIIFDKMREMIVRSGILLNEISRMTESYINFKNGSKIVTLPAGCTGETIRGYTADLIIVDEGAYVPEEVYISIIPSISTKDGRLWLLGTPAGKQGYFYQAWTGKEFSKHHASSYDNIYIKKEFIEEQKRVMSEAHFKQEFLGEFVEEVDSFFPLSLIQQQVNGFKKIERKGERYLGIEVAKDGNDETAYVIIEKINDSYYLKDFITTKKEKVTEVIKRIRELDKKWGFIRILIDETGLGSSFIDILKEAIGGKIIGLTFNRKDKEDIFTNLRYLMEQGRVWLRKDEKLILQMSKVRYRYTEADRLIIQRDMKTGDSLVRALAIAVYIDRLMKMGIERIR